MKRFMYTITLVLFIACSTSCVTRTQRKPIHRTTTVIRVAPKGHKVVFVKGNKYYKWNNKYYKKTRRGFVVVRL